VPSWRQIGTTADDFGHDIAIDPFGNAYISGYTLGSLGGSNAGSFDAFLVKFAVPEPSTFTLAMLCLPALGLLTIRATRHKSLAE
jgi:hypothetical protein